MSFFKALTNIAEIFFPFFGWAFIFVLYLSLSWFFEAPISFWLYSLPLLIGFCMYVGFSFHGYKKYTELRLIKRYNFLLPTLIGFLTVLILFYQNIKNINKDLSEIREEHIENATSTVFDSIHTYLFPFVIISFIVVNVNNLKYKRLINLIAIASCLAFVPINGGRIYFLVFGSLYGAIYLFRNYEKILKRPVINGLKFTFLFLGLCIVATIYGAVRVGSENDAVVQYLYGLNHVNSNSLASLLKLPNNIGLYLMYLITMVNDYTGGNVYYLNIYFDNQDKIDYLGYGFYNFSFLDRFGALDWMKLHDDIDALYESYGVEYNVWATFIRDLAADFGVFGAFIVICIFSSLMFNARKYLATSYSAQILFFMLFAFFLFSPFHSLFYLTRTFGITFVIALVGFFRFRYLQRA